MSDLPPLPPTVEDVVAFLNLPAGYAADKDTLLEEVLAAAIEWAVDKVGPLGETTSTCRLEQSGPTLVLPMTHLASVVSVVDPTGTTLEVDPVRDVNLLAGIVIVPYFRSGSWTVQVTTVQQAASIALAIKIVCKHLWETQRGRGARSAQFASAPEDTIPGPRGFAVPARAAELIRPFARVPAIG